MTDAYEEQLALLASRPRGACRWCGGLDEPFMVHNHVWHHAFPEYLDLKQYLLRRHPDRKDLASQRATFVGACLACVEMRLGRGLTLADFTDAGINNGIRWGYALAQRGT